MNDSNRLTSYVEIDDMRSDNLDADTNDMLDKITAAASNPKKFYFAMEFNQINNPEFQNERYYSLDTLKSYNRTLLYTPQINNISMEMPSIPILYNWDKIPQVKRNQNFKIIIERNLNSICFGLKGKDL